MATFTNDQAGAEVQTGAHHTVLVSARLSKPVDETLLTGLVLARLNLNKGPNCEIGEIRRMPWPDARDWDPSGAHLVINDASKMPVEREGQPVEKIAPWGPQGQYSLIISITVEAGSFDQLPTELREKGVFNFQVEGISLEAILSEMDSNPGPDQINRRRFFYMGSGPKRLIS